MKGATARRRAARRPAPRERILDAAVAEFAGRGFEAASTNAIAAAAGVAKGLVFHHFGSKDDLFVAAFDHVLARLIDALYADLGPLPADLFERLHAWAIHKIRVSQRDPLGYQLMTMAVQDGPPAVRARIEERIAAVRTAHWPRFLDGIDASRLRPGVSLPQAIETLSLLGEGIERAILPRLAALPDRGMSRLDDLGRELWEHFARLRDGLYPPNA